MSNTRVDKEKARDENIDYRNKGILRHLKTLLENNRLGDLLVICGYISSDELNSALKNQQKTQKPLGQIFLEQSKISKAQLTRLLLRQKMVRITAATLLFFSSLGVVGKKAQAGGIKDIPAKVMLTSAASDANLDINHYPSLFGAKEKKSTSLKAFTKWTDMFDRFNANANKSKQSRIIDDLKAELAKFKSNSIAQMAQDVNAMMNEKKYIVDQKNWGKSDYWATPVEFMARGGDCEDFAIAKYVALRALGVAENRMRIAIVQDLQKNIPHAILIVYAERGPLVLDNQIKNAVRDTTISHYKPIFSINREAWWLHTQPERSSETIVAAAN